MDRYELADYLKNSPVIEKTVFIQELCRNREVLDLGCIRHNADFAKSDPNWLHQKIRDVAKRVVGIDYLADEVGKLQNLGYDIRFGDVTKPLPLDEKFDVIVAGDLIEHLTNFEGFFDNCSRLLREGGVLIISTPNPFFTDEFHYVSYKRNFLINPEHTCWIDPQALSQLARRFRFRITEIHFLTNPWRLGNMIWERRGFEFDILNDRWSSNSFPSRLLRFVTDCLFRVFYFPLKTVGMTNTWLVRYSDYIAVLKND